MMMLYLKSPAGCSALDLKRQTLMPLGNQTGILGFRSCLEQLHL